MPAWAGAVALRVLCGALAGIGFALLSGTAQAADEPLPAGIEVGPGIYLQAAASEAGGEQAEPAEPVRSPRIVGGVETTITKWPWQVSLGYHPDVFAGNGFERHFCGGTLVTRTIVISAAHCVFDGADFDDPDLFRVIAGRTQLSTTAGQELDLANLYYFVDGGGNPLYDPFTDEWDVVILELESIANQPTIRIAAPGERSA